jgi:hypothetical protein
VCSEKAIPSARSSSVARVSFDIAFVPIGPSYEAHQRGG